MCDDERRLNGGAVPSGRGWFAAAVLDDYKSEQAAAPPAPVAGIHDPSAPLGPTEMVDAVCRGLQENDRQNNDGYVRLYESMTPQGRTYVAPPPPRHGRLDGVSFEYFMDNACDPVFALVGCDSYTIVETSQVPADASWPSWRP